MNTQPIMCGEPTVFRFVWAGLYLFLAGLLAGLCVFVVSHWRPLPVAIRALTLLAIAAGVAAIVVCIRCWVGKDGFLLDHPISCKTSAEGVEITGLFSRIRLTKNEMRDVRQFGSWTVVESTIAGKTRQLWFAPWFRNREALIRSIKGG